MSSIHVRRPICNVWYEISSFQIFIRDNVSKLVRFENVTVRSDILSLQYIILWKQYIIFTWKKNRIHLRYRIRQVPPITFCATKNGETKGAAIFFVFWSNGSRPFLAQICLLLVWNITHNSLQHSTTASTFSGRTLMFALYDCVSCLYAVLVEFVFTIRKIFSSLAEKINNHSPCCGFLFSCAMTNFGSCIEGRTLQCFSYYITFFSPMEPIERKWCISWITKAHEFSFLCRRGLEKWNDVNPCAILPRHVNLGNPLLIFLWGLLKSIFWNGIFTSHW